MKGQARAVMSRLKSLLAYICCLWPSRPFILHAPSTSPCSSASCKEEVSLAATCQERQKREAKANADEAASEPHNIDNIDEDNKKRQKKHYILSVSSAKET